MKLLSLYVQLKPLPACSRPSPTTSKALLWKVLNFTRHAVGFISCIHLGKHMFQSEGLLKKRGRGWSDSKWTNQISSLALEPVGNSERLAIGARDDTALRQGILMRKCLTYDRLHLLPPSQKKKKKKSIGPWKLNFKNHSDRNFKNSNLKFLRRSCKVKKGFSDK